MASRAGVGHHAPELVEPVKRCAVARDGVQVLERQQAAELSPVAEVIGREAGYVLSERNGNRGLWIAIN